MSRRGVPAREAPSSPLRPATPRPARDPIASSEQTLFCCSVCSGVINVTAPVIPFLPAGFLAPCCRARAHSESQFGLNLIWKSHRPPQPRRYYARGTAVGPFARNAERKAGSGYPTRSLTRRGCLFPHGNVKGTIYSVPENSAGANGVGDQVSAFRREGNAGVTLSSENIVFPLYFTVGSSIC